MISMVSYIFVHPSKVVSRTNYFWKMFPVTICINFDIFHCVNNFSDANFDVKSTTEGSNSLLNKV